MHDDAPRVLIWTNSVLPGSETFIRNQLDALKRWQGQLAGTHRRDSPLSRDDDYGLYSNGMVGTLMRKLHLRLGFSPQVFQLLRRWHPDVVHAHFVPNAWSIARAARIANIPMIVTAHGVDITVWPAQPGRKGRRSRRRALVALHQAVIVIAVSEFIRDQVVSLGIDPAKVVLHHIGIPIPPHVAIDPSPQWDVAYVGRFTDKKGIIDLIDALNIVASTRQINAVFIGDGPLLPLARSRATELGASIDFLGSQPPPGVTSVLAQSRMLAGPSKTAHDGDSEGFGMVFLEAAAASLPVVATLHGGIPEAVQDGVTGLLSPEGDVAALASNIRALLEDPVRAREMGSRGRSRVERDFNIVAQTKLLEEIYDEAARRGRASR